MEASQPNRSHAVYVSLSPTRPYANRQEIKNYFQSEQAGNCGVEYIRLLGEDDNSYLYRVAFVEQSGASNVLARPDHEMVADGHKISLEVQGSPEPPGTTGFSTSEVKLITKKKSRPPPIKKQCLFLKGIPNGCSSKDVKLFIENRTSMEPTIQYGEKPGTAICTFSRDIPDLEDVIRKFSQRKLKGASLKAEQVHHSDAILVQGISQDLKMVELHFNNKNESGGSGVKDLQPGPMYGQAIVYFEDWKVVHDVLTKDHQTLGKHELRVDSYHDFLGGLSLFDAPTPRIPKPVSVEVQEPILEFLYGKGKHAKKLLLKELTKVKANLQWPDGSQKSQAKLEPVIDDTQHQSSWLNWEKKAVNVLTDFMKGYKTARVSVPQSLWNDVVDTLQKITTTCSKVRDGQFHEVILVGEQKDVDFTQAAINEIIIQLLYDAEQAKEDIIWDAEKLQQFTLCGIKQQIDKSFPDLKITVSSSNGKTGITHSRRNKENHQRIGAQKDLKITVSSSYYDKTGITIDGMRKTIKEAKLNIRRMMESLEKTEFKAGGTKVRFVQHVSDKIHEVLGLRNIHASCRGSNAGKITIHGATSRDVSEAKAYIDTEINEDMIAIKGLSALAVVQGHAGKRLLDSINNPKFVMVCISRETGARFIKLAGFKRNVDETKKHIMDFLKKNVIIRSTIPSNRSTIRLITTYHGHELERVGQQHQHNLVTIQLQMSGRNKGFIIQGNEEGYGAVHTLVTSLVTTVKEKQYHVSKTGMARLLHEEKGKNFLESVEKGCHCVIKSDWSEESDDDQEEEGATLILCSVSLPDSTCILRVCQGDLTRQRVDCIVNAANVELRHIGGVAAAIVKAGGNVIQTESNHILKQKKRKLHVGEAVLTSSGNLPCKEVIHVAGPKWRTNRGDGTTEEQELFDAVFNCLQLASELNFRSIAIPAISTGVYGFPVKLAAEQFLNAVAQFVLKTPNSSVTDINLTNNDHPTCAVFMQAVVERFPSFLDDQAAGTDVDVAMAFGGTDRNRPIPVELSSNQATESPRFTISGLNVVTLEGLTIKMIKGSIAVEAVDVIVNTAGSDMNLVNGKVSQAISQAAGPTLQQECDTLIATRGNVASWLFVETGPGTLACKTIYHCVCEGYKPFQSEQFLKKLVLELMVHASRNGMTSMAIPALGTGQLSYPPAVSARCMYEAAFKFSRQHPNGSLKDVHFVVYDKDLEFGVEIQRLNHSYLGATRGVTGITNYTKLEKGKSRAVTSAAYGIEGVEDEKKEGGLQETVILQLYAMDMNSLMTASYKLDTFQADEFLSEDLQDIGLIDNITAEHEVELMQIGWKHDVTVEPYEGRAKFIRVEGCKYNVKVALLDILKIFARKQKKENEKQRIEILSKEVKWKYSTPLSMEDFNEEFNAILEEAYQKKMPNVKLDMEEGRAIVDFQQMQATLNEIVIDVHRVDLKSAARFETPSNWIPMKPGELTKMVKLTAGSPEYTAVETNFRASVGIGVDIIEIEKIQNQDLMMQYQARRVTLEHRLKRTNVEMVLYHGTDNQTSKKISSHGFDRSFSGKNATVYGDGTYFAVAAGYSAHSKYSIPDENGTQHIFVTRVLVGDYVRGHQGMITPPGKPQSQDEKYDSVVDNMNAPGIYVIFHDAQAYPEYLIKFKKRGNSN